jgi:hypothetical protein
MSMHVPQYNVSHAAACFGTLEDAVDGTQQVALLAPGSALRILEYNIGADGLEYVQFAAASTAGRHSILYTRRTPFIDHLGTKGKRVGAALTLQAAWAARVGLHRRTRAIVQCLYRY